MLKIIIGIILSLGCGGLLAYEYEHDPHHHHPTGPAAAPEIDPAGAMSAMTLLAGGLAVLVGRRRVRD